MQEDAYREQSAARGSVSSVALTELRKEIVTVVQDVLGCCAFSESSLAVEIAQRLVQEVQRILQIVEQHYLASVSSLQADFMRTVNTLQEQSAQQQGTVLTWLAAFQSQQQQLATKIAAVCATVQGRPSTGLQAVVDAFEAQGNRLANLTRNLAIRLEEAEAKKDPVLLTLLKTNGGDSTVTLQLVNNRYTTENIDVVIAVGGQENKIKTGLQVTFEPMTLTVELPQTYTRLGRTKDNILIFARQGNTQMSNIVTPFPKGDISDSASSCTGVVPKNAVLTAPVSKASGLENASFVSLPVSSLTVQEEPNAGPVFPTAPAFRRTSLSLKASGTFSSQQAVSPLPHSGPRPRLIHGKLVPKRIASVSPSDREFLALREIEAELGESLGEDAKKFLQRLINSPEGRSMSKEELLTALVLQH